MNNNDNIVKIGTALKWRNTYDINKKYYMENIATACGCVFRCKVLQTQGKPPFQVVDALGHIDYINTDIWDVLVDTAYYYNFAVDTKKLTEETLAYVRWIESEFNKQQSEIAALQAENSDQWDSIHTIEEYNAEQQREIDSVLDSFCCFSEGIWYDTLLWSNEPLWDDNKYAITDNLQNQINELLKLHLADTDAINDHIQQHEQDQAAYEETTDAKLMALALGAKTSLSVAPAVVYKNTTSNVTLKASVNIDDDIESLTIFNGNSVVGSTAQTTLTATTPVTLSADNKFRAETKYKGMMLPASVTLYARYPVYCGFGTNLRDVYDSAHKLSARTSAAGTYRHTSSSNGVKFYILVPSDINALTDFSMGGAPYVMNQSTESLDGIAYKVYESGGSYNSGATVEITAK